MKIMGYIRKLLKFKNFGVASLPHIQGSFSQFGEDLFLRWHFADREPGFYVDVGAFHPHYFSNTHYLSSFGWKGINIEANPLFSHRLAKHRPRDINVNCAVSDTEGEVTFRNDAMCSGIVDDAYTGDNEVGETFSVSCRTLANILDEHLPQGQNIDVLSIDCEGHDLRVVAGNRWEKYRPEVVLIEDHDTTIQSPTLEAMEALDYSMVSWYYLTKVFLDNRSNAPRPCIQAD